MNRRGFALASLVGFALIAGACSDAFDWREFDWPEGEFKVLFPAKPDKETGPVAIGAQQLQLTLFPVRANGVSFAAGYADLPPNLDAAARAQLLDDAAAVFLKNLGADKPVVRTLTVAGHPGREFRGSGARDGNARAIIGRVTATEKRFYQVVAVAPAARAEEADLQLFIESLKLVPKQ